MSIRVVNRGEFEGGNLRGEQDVGRIKGNTVVECLKGWLIEKNNKFQKNRNTAYFAESSKSQDAAGFYGAC